MESLGMLACLACMMFWGILAVTAQDAVEMGQLILEERLSVGLYPGNVYRTKLYLHPGIQWFRINLQDEPGNPIADSIEAPMTVRIDIDLVDSSTGTIERNYYDTAGVGQLDPTEKTIYGEFPFYQDNVFEVTLLCMLDYYELQVNGYEKFTFDHKATTGKLTDFDVIRIMADPGTVDVCWTKLNLDIIQDNSTDIPKCNQPVQRSICDDLVCYLFSDDHNMYTSTSNPITFSGLTFSGDILGSLEEMAEQFCCLEGLVKDIDSKEPHASLQLATDISTELLTWSGNASWDTVNQITPNGPVSLMDRLDDVAQVIGDTLDAGSTITAETPVISCTLEADTLAEFIQKDWHFKPYEDSDDMISINGRDFFNLGFNSTDIKFTVFGAAYSNLTQLINYNQKGVEEFIVADIISATVFGPDGQVSVPSTYTRRLTDVYQLDGNSSTPRAPFCAFWDDHLPGSEAGGWSTRGCSRITADGNPYAEVSLGDYVTCHCNHTTNYAILMRIIPIDDEGTSSNILDLLTLIGCLISILALLLALGFFIFFKHSSLDTERILIHRNLMGGLLVAMVLFMVGAYLTNEEIACKILAAFLHYLYLAVFCWMLVEGIHLYRLIVAVYGSEKQMAKVYYAIGWGLPLLIVGASAAIKWVGYGVPGVACWLSTMDGFIWAFIGPACVIMVVNFVVLGMVIKTSVLASKLSSQDSLMKVKTGVRSSLVLLPMLGITWTIGLITHLHPVLEYLFVILNSFQGLWLVIVCCLMNGEVRNAFKMTVQKKLGKFSGTVDVSSCAGHGVSEPSKTSGKTEKVSGDKGTYLTDVD